MIDHSGMLYLSKHFEPHTRSGRARILIVDGHSSHICWPVVQYALEHNIHLIQLPSKSTHILQPLDVGCFGLLQSAYERHLRKWLLEDPFAVIRKADFLNLLFHARNDVYTVNTVQKAWKASGCWPIDLNKAHGVPVRAIVSADSATETVSESAPGRIPDTPILIRDLARDTELKLLSKDLDDGAKRSLFRSFVDTTTAKITTYRDIEPRALTLHKLRNGKTRRKITRGSKQVGGSARVLSRKELNEALKKLELAEAAKATREQAALERKLAAEERKNAKQVLETQWKFDISQYTNLVNAWREEVAAIDAKWRQERDEARTAHQRPPKKPTPPVRPKRPIKPKMGPSDLTILEELEEVDTVTPEAAIQQEDDVDEDLVEYMRDLELDRFEQML